MNQLETYSGRVADACIIHEDIKETSLTIRIWAVTSNNKRLGLVSRDAFIIICTPDNDVV
jgi:hypothetical protein